MRREEHQVMASCQNDRAQVVRGPCLGIGRGEFRRRDQTVRGRADAGMEFRGHGVGGVLEEIVARHQRRRRRRQDAGRGVEIGVNHPGDLLGVSTRRPMARSGSGSEVFLRDTSQRAP